MTKPSYAGGLGFDYKWDLGWMNDTLSYLKRDPIYRKWHHHDITFSMAYFYSERFILPFSHDEVVHGKATIVDKVTKLVNCVSGMNKRVVTGSYWIIQCMMRLNAYVKI